MIEDKFKVQIGKEKEKSKKQETTFNILGSLRLLSFIVIVYFAYRYIKKPIDGYFYLLVLNILIFIVLILYHIKIKDRLNFSKKIIEVNERYLERINGQWIHFKDKGEEFIDPSHRYSSDLDIVGDRSLFQLINITNTFYGRRIFSKDLLSPGYSKREIVHRQEAIDELKDKFLFCQNLQVEASSDRIEDPSDMLDYFHEDKEIYGKNIMNLLKFLPLFTIITSTIIILFGIKSLNILIFALLVLQSLIWLFGMKKNNEVLNRVDSLNDTLDNYVNVLKLIDREDFKSQLLKKNKEKLFGKTSSLRGIKRLQAISQRINIKSNGLLYIVFNVVFLWDYQNAFSLEAWRRDFGDQVETWLYSIGEIEALTSFTVPFLIEDHLSFPSIEDEDFALVAKEIGHPLIRKDERIYNDISIEDQILIVTGSNMSGKTTFLRTLGINIVLANAGAPTYTRELSLPIMDIYTSMRIVDDLKNKISTFYGELLRIKEILDYGQENKNTFFLIDEIFRGTNSEDRIYGARNVLRNLNKNGLMGAITTHDLELCQLDSEDRIVNYNFSEDYIDGLINFDYKIKKGKSTSTNAKHLMELVGIELLE